MRIEAGRAKAIEDFVQGVETQVNLDALEEAHRRARRDEEIVCAALEKRREALQSLVAAHAEAEEMLHFEQLKAASEELETAYGAIVAANLKVMSLTRGGDPRFALTWAVDEMLELWRQARRRWLDTSLPDDGTYLA